MTFTKQTALHDKITIDGSDMSNAFRSFNLDSTDSDVDLSGFSVSGTDETESGTRAQSFTGDAFQTPENELFFWTLHSTRAKFAVEHQPDGLVDSSRPKWTGICQLRSFPPQATRAEARVMTLTFRAADDAGITVSGT